MAIIILSIHNAFDGIFTEGQATSHYTQQHLKLQGTG